jgi:aspartyl-tRNA(Asn)/glutamyl-tRNA(Gln) amidotransferase subunit A
MFAGKIIEENTTKQWTIGIPIEYNISELSPLVKEAWIDAIELLQANGYKIVPISLPSTKSALSAYYVLAPAEASSNLAKYDGIRYGTRAEGPDGTNGMLYSKTRAEGFGDEVKRRILLGSYSLSADAVDNYFIQAQKVRRLVQMEFNDVFAAPHPLLESGSVFKVASDVDWASGPGLDSELPASSAANEKVDYILCPTAPTPPPRLEDIENQTPVESYINDVFTVPASMAGLPAISIFWGGKASLREKDEKRDPAHNVGLQIIGQFGRDHGVISMAKRMGYYRKSRDGGGS